MRSPSDKVLASMPRMWEARERLTASSLENLLREIESQGSLDASKSANLSLSKMDVIRPES